MISVESLTPIRKPGPAQEHRPAQAAQREAEVEDEERDEDQRRVRRRAMSAGTLDSACAVERRRRRAMIASGTRIETIVRGWRSRWLSETRSTASSSRLVDRRGRRRRLRRRRTPRARESGSGPD